MVIAPEPRSITPDTTLRPGFDSAIAPLTRTDFIDRYWDRTYVHIKGRGGRFAGLLSWNELNRILEQHRLQPPRLVLFQEGKALDPKLYLALGETDSPRLKPAEFMNCLSAGASLVLNHVDELSPGIRELASGFEDALQVKTLVNLYAGWRKQRAFNVHWDSQDTMILQSSGRKHWKVYEPTRSHPLRDDIEQAEAPTGDPVFDGILEDGDMLYMPRGWWHVAFPLDEPSLHLTITLIPSTGVDFLNWFVKQLRAYPEVRQNVPHLGSAAEREAYLKRLFSLAAADCKDDLLDRFLRDVDAKAVARPRVNLPEGVTGRSRSISAESSIRLLAGRRLSLRHDAARNVFAFEANGRHWECAPEIAPAMNVLSHNTPHSVNELCNLLWDPRAASKLKMMLAMLSMGGVISVEGADA